jgi:hydrogenase expression/formation protein HypD
MKYLHEYRHPELATKYLEELAKKTSRPWSIMEVCGGQTHSLVKNGILDLLPDSITMIHGPGCPVCVTPVQLIDKAVQLALKENVILCSFGDMLRVPGSKQSLLDTKAQGADVRILYSPLEAVKIAENHPDKEVVFFGVGFETTAPANALSVIQASKKGLRNYTLLSSQVLVPPAVKALLEDPDCHIDGLLAAGHVCTIMGHTEYQKLATAYNIPIVVTGFEPIDLIQGILKVVEQLESKKAQVTNAYSRYVKEEGNKKAQEMISEVFESSDQQWRGIGEIPESGYRMKQKYAAFDTLKRFTFEGIEAQEHPECISGQIIKGIKKPFECPQFGKKCSPSFPLGAPMVSSEGACAAYYRFSGFAEP